MMDHRQYAPATSRNRDPILSVLRPVLPASGTVLEIASGSGEHAVHFASALPHLSFQPSDPSRDALLSIEAWIEASGLGNIRTPVQLDVSAATWPVTAAAAMICINMIHISPWAATEGLFAGAGRLLPEGAPLYLYGPYKRAGVALAPSNQAFDENLKSRNAEWGLRDLDAVAQLARSAGFGAPNITEMPANNLSVIFLKL